MKALVTGDAGFIGQALKRELLTAGWTVCSFDVTYSTNQNVADRNDVEWAFDLYNSYHAGLDVVVHLAAEVGKLNCEQNPERALEVNVGGTMNVAKACAAYGIPLVYCSTSEVYGDVGDQWVGEGGLFETECEGVPAGDLSGAYAMTKLWGEQVCDTYAPDGLKIVRPTMPYGPGVPPGPGRRALDNLVWRALTGQPMVVHRDAARSWCWIDDLARGFVDVIEKGDPGTYNVGRDDDEIEMLALSAMIARHCGLTSAKFNELLEIVEPPKRQTAVKRISCDKLRALGWEPRVSLDEGLPKMVEWVRSWMSEQERERANEDTLGYHLPFPGCCDAHS